MKKYISIILAAVMLTTAVYALPYTQDERIFADPVRAEYTGRQTAVSIIQNINFTDLPGDPVFEPVARLGALNIIKGYDNAYRPNDNASNVETIGTIIRAMGQEAQANRLAAQLVNRLPEDSDLRRELKIGYLNLAQQYAFITPVEYAAVTADQETLDPQTQFIYDGPVTRQRAANWIFSGLTRNNANAFEVLGITINQDRNPQYMNNLIQDTFHFDDWNLVHAENLTAVEALVAAGALYGTDGNLRPNDYITKAELAYLYKVLDQIIYNIMSIEKKNGTVGGILTEQEIGTGSSSDETTVYIRAADGRVDIIRNKTQRSASAPPVIREVVVFKNDTVGKLDLLEEGDEIEYLVNPETGEVHYIEVRNDAPAVIGYVTGKFRTLSFYYNNIEGDDDPVTDDDIFDNIETVRTYITIEEENGSYTVYTLSQGMHFYNAEGVEFLVINNRPQPAINLQPGSLVRLRTTNNIVDSIEYLGEPTLVDEFRGIVIDNDPDLGYIVVFDNYGKRIISSYYPTDITVKKREYYDNDDTIGYINEVFPNFRYNPLETTADAIEPGDIVFIVKDPDDPELIKSISAAVNYTPKYGKILQYTYNEDGYYEMLFEYENKQTAWFDVSPGLFISRGGRPVPADSVIPGDWARILVNQAIIDPGYVLESVKEIVLEGGAHNITAILRGQLSGFNPTQNKLLVKNVLELTADGWRNYKQTADLSISGRDIEYYHNNKRVSFDYVNRNFRRSDLEVYVALENNFAGEKVRKVTFRDGRDELLSPAYVTNADGNGNFNINPRIATDSGTIVRRHGRLADGINIMYYDYAVVSLNNGNTAAVVDIIDAPGNEGVILHRAEVFDINERRSAEVSSFSRFRINTGTLNWQWEYSPVNRVYSLTYNTTFVTEDEQFLSYDRFLDYLSMYDGTPLREPVNAADRVYYFAADGTEASWIIEAPWSNRVIKGTVYAVDLDEGIVHIKDSTYRSTDADTLGQWKKPRTATANTAGVYAIRVPANSLIFKNNGVIGKNGIEIGSLLTILTPDLEDKPWENSNVQLDGHIIFIEN